jgi:hypothetical protein
MFHLGVARELQRQEFDGNGVAEHGIACPPHFCHSSLAQLPFEHVLPNFSPDSWLIHESCAWKFPRRRY